MTESYYNKPFIVVDMLPERVPQDSPGQFFAVERFFLEPGRRSALREKFTDLLLKLNCYCAFRVFSADGRDYGANPAPEKLRELVCGCQVDVRVLILEADALIALERDDMYLTVYNPNEKLLGLVKALAGAEGLFCRRGAWEESE